MRLAHLSDVHALDLAGVSPLAFFNKRFLGGLNLLRKRAVVHPLRLFEALCDDVNQQAPDHVAVTGDLSNLSLPSELARARTVLERLALGAANVSVIPGNHDAYVWTAYLSHNFEKAFAAYCQGDETRAAAEAPFPYVRVRGELAIVGCSTALPSPPPLADGWLGRRQLARLRELLAALGQRGLFRVLLIHHPPLPQRMDLLRGLRDRKRLQTILGEVGCELVLHGHEHRDLRGSIAGPAGPIPVIGVGSGTYDDPRPERRARYNIYTVERAAAGWQLSIEQRVHSPERQAFFSSPPPFESRVLLLRAA